jgi:hypothetical protein
MTIDGGAFFRFLIAALATWRLAFLLARERGPGNIFGRLRGRAPSLVSDFLKCVKCVGLWVAVPFAFFVRGEWLELVVTWLALAGVTALIDEWTRSAFEWQEDKQDGLTEHDTNRDGERLVDLRDRRD